MPQAELEVDGMPHLQRRAQSAIIVTPGGSNMELFDLYDDERNFTGETIERGKPLPENRYHLVIHMHFWQ